jgi:DNA polymerase
MPEDSALQTRLRRALIGRLESLQMAGVIDLPRPQSFREPLPAVVPTSHGSSPAPVVDPVGRPVAQPVAEAKTSESTDAATAMRSGSQPEEERSVAKSSGWSAARCGALFADEDPASQSISNAPSLQVLQQEVALCTRCNELARSRTQTVFGVGNPSARLCFVGEAPGADEDRLGEPFVGRGGQLLNKIIEACRLKREEVYICNVLKCRPPGNRNPLPEEAANCRRYLERQLELVGPAFICCLGAVAAQNLLGTTQPIGRLRGKVHTYRGAKVVCTYHPAYLLRNPAAKKDTWDDMKLLMREMGVEL